MWSIGVTTYLLLCGCLPFDHETSEREIARQTIHAPTPFPVSLWKRLSPEAKMFVDSMIELFILDLLAKDPAKRMDVKQALQHPWILKFNKSSIVDTRGKNKDSNASDFVNYSTTEELKQI